MMSKPDSSLVEIFRFGTAKFNTRTQPITKITPHYAAGVVGSANLLAWGYDPKCSASWNYGIGNDGVIHQMLEENKRAWTSSSAANDQQAITMEIGNSTGFPTWEIGEKALTSFVDLCVDICKRNPGIKQKNGKSGVYYDGTANASITFHKMFANTPCPGAFFESKIQGLCAEINKRLENGGAVVVTPPAATSPTVTTFKPYTARVTASALNIRRGAGTDTPIVSVITDKGIYTIVEERNGVGASKWGKLKSGAGWIGLGMTEFIKFA